VAKHPSPLHPPAAPETAIARLLTVMLAIGVVVVLVSGILFLHAEGGTIVAYGSLAPPEPGLTQPAEIVRQAIAGQPAALLQLGVLLLLVTPLAREFVTLLVMAKRREWVFVAIAAAVCGILVWGLVGRS